MKNSLKSVLRDRDYFLDTVLSIVDDYHCDKNTSRILHIIAETKAYPIGIRDSALKEYLLKNWDVSNLAKLSKIDDFYDEIEKPERNIKITSSSPNNSWNRRFAQVMQADVNMRKELIPSPKEIMRSPIKQIEEEYISRFDKYRKEQALQIKEKYSLTKDFINTIYQKVLHIISTSNDDCADKIAVIKMLETYGIEDGLRSLYMDLGWFESYIPLKTFRKNTNTIPNTICYFCGNAINLQNINHYCPQQLNRSCYEQRKRDEREEKKELEFIKSNKKCVRCGRDAKYEESRRIRKATHLFCSKQCYESFRKKPKTK